MADAAEDRQGQAPEGAGALAEEESDPPEGGAETRIWTDPRSGERWSIRTITSGAGRSPGRSPRVVVFRREGRRYWVGYCGTEPLADLEDTDLVLLLDSTAVAV